MSKENPYMRVGTTYYKKIEKPMISGDKASILSRWNRETITTDHGKAFLTEIPKYDGFCCIPGHLNFRQEVGDFYNTYYELPFKPIEAGSSLEDLEDRLPYSIAMMKHIFGEHYELGLDYIKILFLHPVQILPVLCLVSEKRNTGKSTLLKWLREIFGFNMTYIKAEAFKSQFNADWASKLLVALDEVLFNTKEITERLKFLSTTNKDKLEAKGKDRQEIDFFAKFILCSNNEDNFLLVDEEEIRFWVLKINPIEKNNKDFLEFLKKEIPVFLRYLIDRPFHTERKTRMWFEPEEIRSKALVKLVWRSSHKLEAQMLELFYEFFESQSDDEIKVVPQDVLNLLEKMFKQIYWTRRDVRKVLKERWKLEPQKNSMSYPRYELDFSKEFYRTPTGGRYYTIKRDFIMEMFDEMMS